MGFAHNTVVDVRVPEDQDDQSFVRPAFVLAITTEHNIRCSFTRHLQPASDDAPKTRIAIVAIVGDQSAKAFVADASLASADRE